MSANETCCFESLVLENVFENTDTYMYLFNVSVKAAKHVCKLLHVTVQKNFETSSRAELILCLFASVIRNNLNEKTNYYKKKLISHVKSIFCLLIYIQLIYRFNFVLVNLKQF